MPRRIKARLNATPLQGAARFRWQDLGSPHFQGFKKPSNRVSQIDLKLAPHHGQFSHFLWVGRYFSHSKQLRGSIGDAHSSVAIFGRPHLQLGTVQTLGCPHVHSQLVQITGFPQLQLKLLHTFGRSQLQKFTQHTSQGAIAPEGVGCELIATFALLFA